MGKWAPPKSSKFDMSAPKARIPTFNKPFVKVEEPNELKHKPFKDLLKKVS